MVRCIVKGCNNNSNTMKYAEHRISFFRLPKVEVMRKSWLQKIGEVKMPPTVDDARICSAHFTEASFTDPGLSIAGKTRKNRRRRRLSFAAMPTLNLSRDGSRKNGSTTEYGSKEEEPMWLRLRRFVEEKWMEGVKDDFQQNTEEENPQKTIERLKAELRHQRLITRFYEETLTKRDEYKNVKVSEAECAKLRLKIQNREDEKQNMLVDIKELQSLNNELRRKLQTFIYKYERD